MLLGETACVILFPVVLCRNLRFLEDDGQIWLKHVADFVYKLLCLDGVCCTSGGTR